VFSDLFRCYDSSEMMMNNAIIVLFLILKSKDQKSKTKTRQPMLNTKEIAGCACSFGFNKQMALANVFYYLSA